MIRKALLTLLLTATLGIPLEATAGYRDVLDTGAISSRLAAKSLLNGVTLAGKRLVCAGQRGHIVYSDDQGKSWTQASVPVKCDLLALHFPDATNGWAVGHDGVVLHSSDGGATWAKQFDGRGAAQVMEKYYGSQPALTAEIQSYVAQGSDKPFLDVWFENASTGYIVGAFNLIFKTGDGGKSWTPWFDRIENPKRLHLYAIRPVGQELYITGEQGSVFRLDRQKERFQALTAPYKGTFFGLAGKPGSLVVFGMRGNVFRSPDGGKSWVKVETGVPAGLTGGTVTEDGRIVLVSQAGQVLVSSDNGASFVRAKVEPPVPATAVTALDRNTLVIAGLTGVKVQSIK